MREDAPDPVRDTPFDRRPWLAFIRYGAAAVLVVCSFLWFRDRSKHTDCSDIVATLWDWNLARLLGDISRCPHPSGESINGITAAFFIVRAFGHPTSTALTISATASRWCGLGLRQAAPMQKRWAPPAWAARAAASTSSSGISFSASRPVS